MFPVFFLKHWVRVALVTAVLLAFPLGLSATTTGLNEKTSSEYYHTVQKGDTLWGICKKYFDDPLIWPDLWSKNEQLPNPHWIYPGQILHLYVKDGTVRFEVVDKIPEASKLKSSTTVSQSDAYHYALIDQIGFLRTPSVAPHGVLFKSKDDKKMISRGDMVYVRPEGTHQLLPGQRYTVFRTMPPFDKRDNAANLGLQHYIVGIVEITKQEPELSVATVIESFRSIQTDDLLMPHQKRSPEIPYRDGKKGLEGRLILAEEHYKLIGHDMVGFIDRGLKDGVAVGQSYALYYRESEDETSTRAKEQLLPAIELGSFIVLHTEENTSTVVVTRSDRDIAPGIKFRVPAK